MTRDCVTLPMERRPQQRRVLRVLPLALALSLVSAPLLAEPTFSKKAQAEALFQEATKLYDEGQLRQACAKFEASHSLDEALGTTLRLADCYDRTGQTASAWAAFQAAAAMAQAEGQSEREEIARERAQDVEGRLSHLVIALTPSNKKLEGLELSLNDSPVAVASLGSPLPVNPGQQTLSVKAQGYQTWSKLLTVAEGPATQSVTVPALLPVELEQRSDSSDPRPLVTAVEQQPPRDEGSTQKTWGYASGGVGLALLGLGGYFTYRAYDLNSQSMDHCLAGETTACTQRGKGLRDDARAQGNLATIVGGVGLTLVGVSAVLLLTAPSDDGREGLSLSARATTASADLLLEGYW